MEVRTDGPGEAVVQAAARRRLKALRDRVDVTEFAAVTAIDPVEVQAILDGERPAGLAFVAALESELDEPIWPRLREGLLVVPGDSSGSEGELKSYEPETIDDLAGVRHGRWMVYTESGSRHLIDFSLRLTQRFPPPGAAELMLPNEARSLRSIERARVGETGYWTMHSSDWLIDYLWHLTSTITRIERLA